MKPRNGHRKAPVTESLAASVTRAQIIGGQASDNGCHTTVAAFRAIGLDGYAVQIIAARYQLSQPVAQCVAELAALGGAA